MPNLFALTEWPLPAPHLYEKYAEGLCAQLQGCFRSADPDSIYDAVVDAILDVARKVDQLDAPDQLGGLLFVVAKRKLLGIHRSEKARRRREKEKGNKSVAQQQQAAREQWEEAAHVELQGRIFATVPRSEEERVVLQHWGADFQEIAAALNWQALPEEEQRKRVRKLRDRLGKRLERFL